MERTAFPLVTSIRLPDTPLVYKARQDVRHGQSPSHVGPRKPSQGLWILSKHEWKTLGDWGQENDKAYMLFWRVTLAVGERTGWIYWEGPWKLWFLCVPLLYLYINSGKNLLRVFKYFSTNEMDRMSQVSNQRCMSFRIVASKVIVKFTHPWNVKSLGCKWLPAVREGVCTRKPTQFCAWQNPGGKQLGLVFTMLLFRKWVPMTISKKTMWKL